MFISLCVQHRQGRGDNCVFHKCFKKLSVISVRRLSQVSSFQLQRLLVSVLLDFDAEIMEEVTLKFSPITDNIGGIFLSEMKEIPSIHIGDYSMRLELEDLSPEMKEVAKTQLGETPEVITDSLKTLRQLLNGEEHLQVPIDNDCWLIKFLRNKKYDPVEAFKLIKHYYRFKINYADIYKGLKPSNEKNVFEQNILVLQQERDQYGRRILNVHFGKRWDPNAVSLDEIFKGVVLLSELALLEPQTQVCGVVVIVDMEGLSLTQVSKFNPFFFKRLLEWLQNCIPLNIVNVHVVNQPYIFKIVYNLIKMFLREDMKDRLVLHGYKHESLHQYVNRDSLLENYGGTLKIPTSVDGNVWLKVLLLCDQEFEALNTFGYTST